MCIMNYPSDLTNCQWDYSKYCSQKPQTVILRGEIAGLAKTRYTYA
jgi:hypothetical protein